MKFIIFDIDGTLIDTNEVEDICFITAFQESFNIDIRNQKWEDLQNVTDWGITEEIILREKNRKPTKDEYELMISNFMRNLQSAKDEDINQFKEIPGAVRIVEYLIKEREIEIGIATGAWENSARLKLECLNLDYQNIPFSNSSHFKSRELITKSVIEKMKLKTNCNPEQIIYFGDGEWDYSTCKNLGIKFIGIDSRNSGKLVQLGARTVFQNYLNTVEIMNEIKRQYITHDKHAMAIIGELTFGEFKSLSLL